MKTIKSFDQLNEDGEKLKFKMSANDVGDGSNQKRANVKLTISFGKDQAPAIEKLLDEMKDDTGHSVIRYEKLKYKSEQDHETYDIEFNSTYAVYLFGAKQATMNPFK